MLRLTIPVLALIVAATAPSAVLAQADAQQAYQQAKTAFEAGDFAKARDLARKASQSDPKNAEVFLLLGKAHYQLGELDEAVDAWGQTLQRAPDEPFAKRMLEALHGELADINTRLDLAEALVRERLLDSAWNHCQEALTTKPLTDAQQVRAWILQTEIALIQNRPADALRTVETIRIRRPGIADPAQLALLEGQARLRAGGTSAADGLGMLQKLVANQAGTPAAATAQLEILRHEIRQGIQPTQATALAEWLAASPDHPQVAEALRSLLDTYLAVTRQGPKPKPGDSLSKWDTDAIAVARTLIGRSVRADQAKQLVEKLVKHLDEHYAAAAAYRAATDGGEALLAVELPASARLPVLRALVRYRTALAKNYLELQARTGKLPAPAERGALPDPLAAVVSLFDTVRAEFPAQPMWPEQAQFAAMVRGYTQQVPWPVDGGGLKSPDAWAVDIALPVIESAVDADVQTAIDLMQGIVNDYAGRDAIPDVRLAVELSDALRAVVPTMHAAQIPVRVRHAELLALLAQRVFDDHIKTGNLTANAEVSAAQQQYLAALQDLVAADVKRAGEALTQLRGHMQPWIDAGHFTVAESLLESLAESLPADERRQAKLAVVELWIAQVQAEHARLVSAGLTVPRTLDPTLKKALLRCYALQAGLTPDSPHLTKIRTEWQKVVAHYVALEYFDTAAAAIAVKPEAAAAAVPAADEFAAYQAIILAEAEARRALKRTLRNQYGASVSLTIDDGLETVIRQWLEFIQNRPESALAKPAVERVFGLGQLLEQHAAHAEAAKVYTRLAEFAAGVKTLSQSPLGTVSTAQRAALAAADALRAEAAKVLAEANAKRTGAEPPPTELSAEYVAAVAAYRQFLTDYPQCPAASRAIDQILGVALEYAKIDAWEVAERIYRELLESDLQIRRPERLQFAQGLCQLGRALPDHAREVLQARENENYLYRNDAANQPAQQLPLQAANVQQQAEQQQRGQQQVRQVAVPPIPNLSAAELARQQQALDAAYAIFQAIRNTSPLGTTAEQARAEILVMVAHWRGLAEWARAATLAGQYLTDNPTDRELPKLRLEIARDRLAWAAKPIQGTKTRQERVAEVTQRFDAARDELDKVVTDFPDERTYQQNAQWDIANSYLSQARVLAAFNTTLAQGQYVRAARELRGVAKRWPDHPNLSTIPQMLWQIAAELESRGFHEEAIVVWDELRIYDPLDGHSQQAALKIAQTYQTQLARPLKAAKAYQELNFVRGGNDQELQNAIFQIGTQLKNEARWIEALHVLETFVDSFPRHAQAGQALTMVGQIHQANEAWEDAIAAYRRVMAEFENGQFVQEAKWAIAECTINLSRWREAMDAYRNYVSKYPEDDKVAEANRRIGVLKDLARYQGLVDEEGQRKAFDAQYQIARIVLAELSNPVKATVEYRKVVERWPDSHLADDALYAVGATYLSRGNTEKAREALCQMADRYPASPLADDALYMVGKSYEDEADKLATVTRAESVEEAKQIAQRKAYDMAQLNRRFNDELRGKKIASLKAAGKDKVADQEMAAKAANYGQFSAANTMLFAQQAFQEAETLTATQLADRQDKINASLRKAVDAYTEASQVAGADKADDALLQMATIYDQRLKDSQAAMKTWLEIVRQFSGTAVAEDASWRIAQFYERENKYAEAIEAYQAFLRNYRRSPKAGQAQFAVAENFEHQGEWVSAMDAYTNYVTNFPEGPLVEKAQEQIAWIKTYRL